MKTRIAVTTALVASVISCQALACGDSLYRVGTGVSYRTYSAPLPGNLLIFGSSESSKQLAEQLAMAGHSVRFVTEPDQLTAALTTGGYDVVIAPFSARAEIEINTGASFLPVALNEDEEQLARKAYRHVMSPRKHEIKHYLKAIHRSLKNDA